MCVHQPLVVYAFGEIWHYERLSLQIRTDVLERKRCSSTPISAVLHFCIFPCYLLTGAEDLSMARGPEMIADEQILHY
jgi:hypothetical protein